jgi:hypothetical protein
MNDTTSHTELEYYSLDYEFKGLALILSNYEFTSKRFPNFPKIVSDKDLESFRTLEKFNFQIKEEFLNKTKAEISQIITKYTSFNYSDYGCLFLCMSSHGGQNTIVSSDGFEMDINKDIIKPFYKVESLKDKPKIFLFDCCRGDIKVKKGEASNIEMNKDNNDDVKKEIDFADLSNFFFAYSTILDYEALCSYGKGSYLISTFFEVLDKHGKTDDLSSLQTRVARFMQNTHKQIPELTIRAPKKFAFVKKLENQPQQQVFIFYIIKFKFFY